jgi:hypothetical protein
MILIIILTGQPYLAENTHCTLQAIAAFRSWKELHDSLTMQGTRQYIPLIPGHGRCFRQGIIPSFGISTTKKSSQVTSQVDPWSTVTSVVATKGLQLHHNCPDR